MRTEVLVLFFIFSALTGYYLLHLMGHEVLLNVLQGRADEYVIGIGRGISMLPAIEPGNAVIIDTVVERIDIGDIIVYTYDGNFVGHRVIAITQDGFITKGDNNPYPDNLVPTEAVVGKIVWEVDPTTSFDMWVLERLFGEK